MKLLIAGDVHGRWEEFDHHLQRVHQYYRFSAVLQLGDFGLGPELISHFLHSQKKFAFPIYWIDGNHEDHPWLLAQTPLERRVWEQPLNLRYLPRGEIWHWQGTTIGHLGGAFHVDRPQQRHPVGSNFITSQDRMRALANWQQITSLDLVATHSCPAAIGLNIAGRAELAIAADTHIRAAGFASAPPDDCGEMELTQLWHQLTRRPRHWAFGHFHQFRQVQLAQTSFWAMPEFDRPPLIFWDSESKKIIAL